MRFADYLSNALHDIKQQTKKKISIIQDELGYALEPPVTGDAIERWRYRKNPPAIDQLESVTAAILGYGCTTHDGDWLRRFLTAGGHPYAEAFAQTLFAQPAAPTTTAPPLAAYGAPPAPGFVGRASELQTVAQQLDSHGYAIISGMAGAGKTSLMATLASRQRGGCFWHPFRDGAIDALIWRMAGFLTHFDAPTLWQQLEASRLANVRPPAAAICIDAIVAALIGRADRQPLLICLDDVQQAIASAELQRLVLQLLSGALPQTRLLLTTRQAPIVLSRYLLTPLGGLQLADAQALLDARDVPLAAAQTAALHGYTGGHATFLNFAAVLLQRGAPPAGLLDELAQADSVERYLLGEVDRHLDVAQRHLLEGLALHQGRPAGEAGLAAIADLDSARRALRVVCDQYLVQVERGDGRLQYRIHPILSDFYLAQLSAARKLTLQRRAAEFYERADDVVSAAFFWQGSGELQRAAELLSADPRRLAYGGQAAAALAVLQQLAPHRLDGPLRVALLLAEAEFGAAVGEMAAAKRALYAAAELLNEAAESQQARQQKLAVCLAMAQLLEREALAEGIEWAQRGLALATAADGVLRARLETQLAILQMHTGNFGAALELLDEQQAADLPLDLRTTVLYTLSGLCFYMKQLQRGRRLAGEALRLSEESGDHLLTLRVLKNLGPLHFMLGEWGQAIDALERGLALAQRLGDRRSEAGLALNLAGCLQPAGRTAEAQQLVGRALDVALADGQQGLVLPARLALARLQLDAAAWQEAEKQLRLAAPIARAQNDQVSLAQIDGYQAELLLGQQQLQAARRLAQTALERLGALGYRAETGNLWRTLGRIERQLLTEPDAAAAAFARSVELLPAGYERALAQLDWAELLSERQPAQAAELLQAAAAQLTQFEAHTALERADRLRRRLEKDVS